MSIYAPIRLVVVTDHPIHNDWERQRHTIFPIIQHIWHDELTVDPRLRFVINATLPFTFGERYVSFYMEDTATDEHPVYLVYVPHVPDIEKLARSLRKEYFIRLWPSAVMRSPLCFSEELSNYLFALTKNIDGKFVSLTNTDSFIVYKVSSDTLSFRDYFFRQVRKSFRPVN